MNTHEALAADRATKLMEPFLLRPPVSYDASTYESDSVFSFPGEHFCFVVSGIVEIDFPDRIVRLEAGDSIYFDSEIPHWTRSAKDAPAEILVIIASRGLTSAMRPALNSGVSSVFSTETVSIAQDYADKSARLVGNLLVIAGYLCSRTGRSR